MEIANLAEALCKAQAALKPAEFDSINPHLRNKYASLSSVQRAAKVIHQFGLSYLQMPSFDGDRVSLTTVLLHTSGEKIEFQLSAPLAPGKQQIQALGSTISYLRRYSLSSLLGISVGDDLDGEAAPAPSNAAPAGARQTQAQPRSASQAEKSDLFNASVAFHAICSDLEITPEQKRALLGVSSCKNPTQTTLQRMKKFRSLIADWHKTGALIYATHFVSAGSIAELADRWKDLPNEMKPELETAKDYLKQQLEA